MRSMRMGIHPGVILWAVLAAGVSAPLAVGQTTGSSSQDPDETTMTGRVVSSSRNTLVIRTTAGAYQLFVYDSYTVKPPTVAVGSEVTVRSTPGTEPGVRTATSVAVSSGAAPTTPEAKPGTDVIPASVRQLESDIERQARRYGAGVRAGVALDPELISVGLHARLQFNRDFAFRPNVEFAFGEVTKLAGIHLEGVYRLPVTPRTGRWSSYVGLGPSLLFSRRSFEEADIDFGDWDFDSGLNVLGGVAFRSGVFMEIKSTVWASPHLRLIVGYSF